MVPLQKIMINVIHIPREQGLGRRYETDRREQLTVISMRSFITANFSIIQQKLHRILSLLPLD